MEKFEYTEENLRKLQIVEIDMLKELDRICRKNNINYIIDAGTLLGAVRHQGFIPWDDDIDVRMLREDYDKFCNICSTDLGENYFLQTHITDPEYRWGYARILRKRTTYIRKGYGCIKSQTGIFIDIFPNDALPENPIKRRWSTVLSLLCRKILYSEVGMKNSKKFVHKFFFSILNLIPRKWAHTWRESMIYKNNRQETEKVRCYGWGSPEETLGFRKEWFTQTKDIVFEDLVVLAPENTHDFLVHSFGEDYMTPPPIEERVPRHTAEYIGFL